MPQEYGARPKRGFFESTSSFRDRSRTYSRKRQAKQAAVRNAEAVPRLEGEVRTLQSRLANANRLAIRFSNAARAAGKANAKSLENIKKIKAELAKEKARTRKVMNEVKAGRRSVTSARRTIANQKRKIARLKKQISKNASRHRRSTSEIRDLRREIRSLERATARARMHRQARPYNEEQDIEFPLEGVSDDYIEQLPAGWEGTAMPEQMWEPGQDWYPNDLVM
jgi:chromosome segregation ATPase